MGGSDLTIMARDTSECLVVVNAVMKLPVPKCVGNFLEWVTDRLERGHSSMKLVNVY
jgi:hypothetical protein